MESFSDFIGNKNVIRLVNLLTHDAEQDKFASLPDMAFLGPAGHGKHLWLVLLLRNWTVS